MILAPVTLVKCAARHVVPASVFASARIPSTN